MSSNCDSILKNKAKINKPMPLPLAQNDVAQMDVIIEESADCKEILQGGPSSETTSNDMWMTQTTDQASLVATSVKQPAHVTTSAERSVEKQKND
uniref:Uncharacterized protein n=1 Tax=Glossina morsitans morsitans TaxID=37546 RepID=A0A1B0FME7_GLOMM